MLVERAPMLEEAFEKLYPEAVGLEPIPQSRTYTMGRLLITMAFTEEGEFRLVISNPKFVLAAYNPESTSDMQEWLKRNIPDLLEVAENIA